MSLPTLEITEPGMFTTVQDRGRYGYQRFGVPVSGAMDEFALRAANLLVGNPEGAACLEITVVGPAIQFLADTWVATTGADLTPLLDDEPLPGWQTLEVAEGSILSFRDMTDGMRAYLAVAGGIDVPVVMGSRSTYVKAAIGGYEGRALQQGDVVSALSGGDGAPLFERRLPDGYSKPTYGERHEVRVVLGPQEQAFDAEALATFLGSRYVVSLDSDRMGYRMEGPSIPHKTGPDIISEGNSPGAVQVPGDGIPTILLADRGATGGYTKIATVITADLDKLAQAVPGQSVTFEAVDLETAHEALRERESVLRAIRRQGPTGEEPRQVSIAVDGEGFEVLTEAGEVVSSPSPPPEPSSTRSHRVRATVSGQTYEFEVDILQEE